MAERSFAEEVKKLRLGAGESFAGEGILAVTKALLQSGVAYVAGYQGSPISHLMDVLADAQDILAEMGVHFETSASEATAAATLAASVNYPLRGAVTFKSTVGTNVASDALANLASGGVTGGALVIVGEDYGDGSSIMQERSHAFAMKSQMWLLDPRPNLPSIVKAVEDGFELSEASHTPVMLQLRIRACHVHGHFIAKDNRKPAFTLADAANAPRRDTQRIVLPPASFVHEQEKIEQRWPAAVKFIEERGLNEFFAEGAADVGVIVQGGLYNSTLRAMERLGLGDVYGRPRVPLYVMNVAYPLIDSELIRFCSGKRAVLLVEEGQPNYIEQGIASVLRKADLQTVLVGKGALPAAGEYTPTHLGEGLRGFFAAHAPALLPKPPARVIPLNVVDAEVHARPPGLCTGCPERPVFAALKLVQRELGEHHISADIGCHLFSILPPFHIGNTTMGYGLGAAGAAAFHGTGGKGGKRAISIMGDGGFWHNGLTSGIANAVFNKSDALTLIVDNNYTAATGGQDIPSSRAGNKSRSTFHAIEQAVRGVGVEWVRTIRRTYDVAGMRSAIRDALTSKQPGPKVIVAQSECMLNRQRREKPMVKKAIAAGKRQVREKFGVDSDTCTGDHSCIRISGCPSLEHQAQPRPAAQRPGGHRARQLRRLRHVRRGFARRGAVPVVLSRRGHQQPERPGPVQGAVARFGHRRTAAAARAAAGGAHAMTSPAQPIKIAILAMGGEGGGVLADWIVDIGEHNGHLAQSTSVAGVAQRTGATIYYIELFPRQAAEREGASPVLALIPTPGDVDVLIASELMEAGRAVQRGLVTPDRTTLITSTHRVYSIAEKSAMGDGVADSRALEAACLAAAKAFVRFDMATVGEATGSVISAVLFGALCGAGVLPFTREQFEATIQRGGVGVAASLKAFGEGASRSKAARRAAGGTHAGADEAVAREPRRPGRASAAAAPAPRPQRHSVRHSRRGRAPAARLPGCGLCGALPRPHRRGGSPRPGGIDRRHRTPPGAVDELRGHRACRRPEDTRHAFRTRAHRSQGGRRTGAGHQRIPAPAAAGDLRRAARRAGPLAVEFGRTAALRRALHAARPSGADKFAARLPVAVFAGRAAPLAARQPALCSRERAHRRLAATHSPGRRHRPGAGAGNRALPAPGQGLQRHPRTRHAQLRQADGGGAAIDRRAAGRHPVATIARRGAGRRTRPRA